MRQTQEEECSAVDATLTSSRRFTDQSSQLVLLHNLSKLKRRRTVIGINQYELLACVVPTFRFDYVSILVIVETRQAKIVHSGSGGPRTGKLSRALTPVRKAPVPCVEIRQQVIWRFAIAHQPSHRRQFQILCDKAAQDDVADVIAPFVSAQVDEEGRSILLRKFVEMIIELPLPVPLAVVERPTRHP